MRVLCAGVVSTFTSVCVLGSLYLLLRYALRVHSRFRLPANEVITGRFTGDEVFANMTGHMTRGPRETAQMSTLISKEQVALARE